MIKFIFVAICFLTINCSEFENEIEQRNKSLYSAWCKLNYRTDITYDEWLSLRHNYMLPEQQQRKKEDEARNNAIIGGISTAVAEEILSK